MAGTDQAYNQSLLNHYLKRMGKSHYSKKMRLRSPDDAELGADSEIAMQTHYSKPKIGRQYRKTILVSRPSSVRPHSRRQSWSHQSRRKI